MTNTPIKILISLLVFLMPIFWLNVSSEPFEFNKQYLLVVIVSLGILWWLGIMIFKEKKFSFKKTPLDFYILLYLITVILSTIFSKDKIFSLFGFYGRFWPSLVGTVSLVLFYFLITNHINIEGNSQQKEKKTKLFSSSFLISLFLISTFFVVLITYFSFFGIFPKINTKLSSWGVNFRFPPLMLYRFFNVSGKTIQDLSVFLGVVSVLVITLLTLEKWRKTHILLYILLGLMLPLLVIINFWVAWLGIIFSLVIFLIFAFWKRIFRENVNKLSLPVVILIIGIIFLFFNPLSLFFKQGKPFSVPNALLVPQGVSWQIGIKGLKENPLTGVGIGEFNYLYNKYRPASVLKTNLWQMRFDRAGNSISEIIGTIGVLGTLSYLLILGMFIIISYYVVKAENFKVVPTGLTLIGLIIFQFFYPQNILLAFCFWMFLGISVINWEKPVKEKTFHFKNLPEIGFLFTILFWVILIGCLFFYFTIGKLYLGEINYQKYLKNPSKNVTALEKSVQQVSWQPFYHTVLARQKLTQALSESKKSTPDTQRISNLIAQAVKEGKEAEKLSPNWVVTQETLAMIYRDLQGIAKEAGDWAVKKFQKALELDPKNPILLTELGKLYGIKNDLKKAETFYRKAIGFVPSYPDAQVQLALLKEQQGKIEEGIKILEKFNNLYPYSVEAHFQLGRMYYRQQEDDKAILHLNAALLLFPNHSNSLYILGLIYERKGDIDTALNLMQKVLNLNPDNKQVIEKIEELKSKKHSHEEKKE